MLNRWTPWQLLSTVIKPNTGDGFCVKNEVEKIGSQNAEKFELTEIPSLPRQSICLTEEQINCLGISPGPIALKIGVKVFFVDRHEQEISLNANQIGISQDILAETGLYSGLKLSLITNRNNVLWLGPIFAVLLSPTGWDMAKKGNIVKELKYSEQLAHELGYLMYYFTAHDINWSEQKMLGCYLNRKTGNWEENWLPLPDVVYDLATFPGRKDLLEIAKDILKQFRNSNDTIAGYNCVFSISKKGH